MLKRLRRTKIVTTLGPATDRDNNLEKIIKMGANVVRLNFSHGEFEEHKQRAENVRTISERLGKHVAILGDLQGPKIRISTFAEGKVLLNKGDRFILDANLSKDGGTKHSVGIDYKELPSDVNPNDILLLDDGRIQLKVVETTQSQIICDVIIGGPLSNNKGINKQGGGLSAAALTEKDKQDIIHAASIGVDYLAVSFPRNGDDIHYARHLARCAGSHAKIIAKVERAEAVASDEAMDDIIMASDIVMVARGDLGVEIGDPELVGVQKKLIRRSRALNRGVITATQMMESMITNPLPTRAEVMDVANAVLDGTDAVMLSAETAVGQYPAETVASMASVCLGAEKMTGVNICNSRLEHEFDTIEEAVAMSAMYAANHLKGVKAIIALTESGQTPLMMSRLSSGVPIFALSCHNRTLNQTALYRGVIPIYFDSKSDNGLSVSLDAIKLLCNNGYLEKGDRVLVTQGDMMKIIGSTNTCRILCVE